MPTDHAPRFSPSGSKVWLACFAQPRMTANYPNDTNPMAELGTGAHELGEFCIPMGLNAYDCIGMTFNNQTVDAEMAEAVQLYIGYIRNLSEQFGVKPMLEQRVVLSSISDEIFGTSDCIIIAGDTLHVIDYKHGYGLVDVHGNTQAIIYALATLDTLKEQCAGVTKVVCTIVQPRADHIDGSIRSHEYSLGDMADWHTVIRDAYLTINSENPPFKAGEHCQYCKARGTCGARMAHTLDLVLSAPVDVMNAEQLSAAYGEVKAIKNQLQAIEDKALELARTGETIGGFKLVKAITRAKCDDPEAFIAAAVEAGHSESDLVQRKPKTMTQLKKFVDKSLVDKYFTKPPASTTLAPLTDKRAAISTSAVGVFEAIN